MNEAIKSTNRADQRVLCLDAKLRLCQGTGRHDSSTIRTSRPDRSKAVRTSRITVEENRLAILDMIYTGGSANLNLHLRREPRARSRAPGLGKSNGTVYC